MTDLKRSSTRSGQAGFGRRPRRRPHQDRYDVGVEDVWSALTDPGRLAKWYGRVRGDLRPGGEYHADLGHWVGTGRVDACERAERLLVTMRETDSPDATVVEATVTPDADGSRLVLRVRGLPLDLVGAYGVGWQIHAENLAAHLAGRREQAVWSELKGFQARECLQSKRSATGASSPERGRRISENIGWAIRRWGTDAGVQAGHYHRPPS